MKAIQSAQDLIDILQYAQREWGNDIRIKYSIKDSKAFYDKEQGIYYGGLIYADVAKDGSVIISNWKNDNE